MAAAGNADGLGSDQEHRVQSDRDRSGTGRGKEGTCFEKKESSDPDTWFWMT